MESKDLELFEEFNKKINGVEIYSKAVEIYNEYISKTNNFILQKLMESLMDENNYRKTMQREQFFKLIKKLEKYKFRGDCKDIEDNIYDYTEDAAQINTIRRLIKKKETEPDIVPLCNLRSIPKKEVTLTKKCPHCGMSKTEDSNAEYVICGYNTKGFDWQGCGFDWCFQCGKKLCKCWNVNHLYNLKNRYHNNKCCRSHALKTGGLYPDEYCQCRNKFVRR